MNFRLIQNWNSRVAEDDTVFHIGDFCYKSSTATVPREFIKQLNGMKVFLRGNHDRNNSLSTCIEDIRICLGGKNILLIHNPSDSSHGFDLVLAGHVHEKWKFKTMVFERYKWDVVNVGVDVWRGFPVDIQEILNAYSKWKRDGIQDTTWT